MSLRRAAVRIVPLLLLAAACDSPREDTPEAGLVGRGGVRVVANEARVENPDRPVYSALAARLDTLWRLEADVARWVRPAALTASPEGLLVLDAGAPRVDVVTREGLMVRTLRPHFDQLVAPTSIAWGRQSVAVADSGTGQVVISAFDGSMGTTYPLRDEPYVLGLGSGEFLLNGSGGIGTEWTRYGLSGIEPVLLPGPALGGEEEMARCHTVSAGGEWILRAACGIPAFEVISGDGAWRVRHVSIARYNSPFRARLASLRAVMDSAHGLGEAAPDSVMRAVISGGLTVRTVRGVRFDPGGMRFALWSAPADSAGGTRVDVLSREGVFLASYRFAAPWTDVAFDGGVFYVLEQAVGEAPALAAYRLRLPGDSLALAPPAALQ